jgi:hypothetical protein
MFIIERADEYELYIVVSLACARVSLLSKVVKDAVCDATEVSYLIYCRLPKSWL